MQPSTLHHAIETESWDHIARMLVSFPIDIGEGSAETRRLRKQLEAMKHALHWHLMSCNGSGTIEASFLVGTVKAVSRIERGLDAQGIKNQRFVMFLKLLLHRLRRQKLVVKKPMEMRKAFGAMKKVVENAGPI